MSDAATGQSASPATPPPVPAGPPPFSFGSFVVGLTVGVVAGLFGGAVVVPLLEPMVRSGGAGVVTKDAGGLPPGTPPRALTPDEAAKVAERQKAADASPEAAAHRGEPVPEAANATDPKAEPAADPTKPAPVPADPAKAPGKP